MTILKGFAITIVSGVIFALAGGLFGYALGSFAPDYYRTVFRIPPEVELDPSQTGLGLGMTQGFAAGLGIGLFIVATVAWFNAKLAAANSTTQPNHAPENSTV